MSDQKILKDKNQKNDGIINWVQEEFNNKIIKD